MVRVIGSGLETHIAQQARNQAMAWIAEAEQQAAQLVAQAAEEAERLHGGAEAEASERVRTLRRRLVARAEMEAREELLRTQEEILERVWRVAKERLAELDAASSPEQRLARLEELVWEAALKLGGGGLEVQTNQRDRELLPDEVLAAWAEAWQERLPGVHLSVVDEPAPIMGGVMVRPADGRELVDNSYEQRLAVARETLHTQVMAILARTPGEGED